jgi:hypothetical protein
VQRFKKPPKYLTTFCIEKAKATQTEKEFLFDQRGHESIHLLPWAYLLKELFIN